MNAGDTDMRVMVGAALVLAMALAGAAPAAADYRCATISTMDSGGGPIVHPMVGLNTVGVQVVVAGQDVVVAAFPAECVAGLLSEPILVD